MCWHTPSYATISVEWCVCHTWVPWILALKRTCGKRETFAWFRVRRGQPLTSKLPADQFTPRNSFQSFPYLRMMASAIVPLYLHTIFKNCFISLFFFVLFFFCRLYVSILFFVLFFFFFSEGGGSILLSICRSFLFVLFLLCFVFPFFFFFFQFSASLCCFTVFLLLTFSFERTLTYEYVVVYKFMLTYENT